ncbi:Ig-like domain-containing protein [Paenibacillus hexagrammi]|uniref:Ig-like domain-containing protein n=1 Tax=Paenibacillus hexagrammi TaxID=2908839 RepID=A0ABY3SDE2_9BACL|nr:Ig-like domain-containing protein [Paenibacillus sp. YPD9-1]UJF31430.1 Ig-like domain-containing protein [Paenibacillus sp. YPD9-1]
MRNRPRKRVKAAQIALGAVFCSALLTNTFPPTLVLANENPVSLTSNALLNASAEGTQSIDFNNDWQFYLATRTPTLNTGGVKNGLQDPAGGPSTEEIISPGFDDSSWRTLNVPHDWSIEGQKVSGASNAQGYLQGGLGWYRKTFTLPETLSEKKIYIDFDGVYTDSIVYVNGNAVGEYPNGYTGFSYDITPYLHYGNDESNVIVVKVQNMAPSGRWYTGSGITRPVHLLVTDKTHFLRHGVTYTTADLETSYKSGGSANLAISADLYSEASNGVAQLRTSVIDASGNVVASHTSDAVDYNPSTKLTLLDSLNVPNVHLWSTEDPYLYKIRTELITEINGGTGPQVVDSSETEYGFRWFKMEKTDPANTANSGGFYLNGVYTKLQGVDLHHDDGALGAAGNLDAAMRKFKILKDMGVNAFRTSHNPPSKEVIQACERLGIVVMEEAFDGWGSAKASYDFGNWFLTNVPEEWAGTTLPPAPSTPGAQYMWSDWVIQEMVNRDKNSPAVVMWSIGNEVRGVGSKPSWMNTQSLYGVSSFNEYSEAIRLKRDISAIDPTRPVVMGGDQQRNAPSTSSTWGLIDNYLSGFGLNYNTAQSVDVLMSRYPNTFFFESESSSQTSARGVYQDPSLVNTGVNQTPGSRGTSSYDNNFASWTMGNEYGLKKDRDRKPFLGQFIWSGFDYIGEPTPYNIYPVGVSSFGAIDTAGFPKDSYYLFKSQWTKQPMAHIVPMDWTTWRPGEDVEVWVNTNQQSAELFLNGQSLGRKSFDVKTTNYGREYYETSELTKDDKLNTSASNTGGYLSPTGTYGKLHLTWNVPFTPGTLEVKTYADTTSSVVTATDVIRTAAQPYTITLSPDKRVIAADGKSLSYVEADVVDQDGNIVPNANNLLKFDVTGGTIVGVDNGKQESNELYKWENVEHNTHSERSAYNGKALVIIQSNEGQSGPITVNASFDGSVAAQTTVYAKDGDSEGNLGVVPVQVSVMKGSPVSLPSEVSVVHADGTTSQEAVTWTNVPSTSEVGTFQAAAAVNGLQAKAEVTVYDVADASVKISTAVGEIPVLPENVKVKFTHGLNASMPVKWPEITASQVQNSGILKIKGQIQGVASEAEAIVKISSQFTPDVNLALSDQGTGAQDTVSSTGPLATASFTNGTSYPNLMLDGNTTSGGWTNRYSISATANLPLVNATRPYEFVQVYWPDYKTFHSIKLYFTTGGTAPTNNLPKSLDVQYWNGLQWVSAKNQQVNWATASNEATTITFDPAIATKVRVGMENATPYSSASGAMAITEFEVYGTKVDASTNMISEIKPVEVTTEVGTAPSLPSVVDAVYEDGTTVQLPVTWDNVSPDSYSQVGNFEVHGSVEGTDIQALAQVTVTNSNKVTGITLNKSELSLVIGSSETLLANVLPDHAATKKIIWSTSDSTVAVVDGNGLVTAVSLGSASITAKTEDGGFEARASVTVSPVPPPKGNLSETGTVHPGQTFSMTYSLNELANSSISSIYAQDVVVSFDPAILEFVQADSVKEGLEVVESKVNEAGQLRLLLASLGQGNDIHDAGSLVQLTWKVKSGAVAQSAVIGISSLVLSDETGREVAAALSSQTIPVSANDHLALTNLILLVQSALSTAVEGSQPGQYPVGSKTELQSALSAAILVNEDSSSSQDQIDAAVSTLDAALQTFRSKLIAGIPGDANHDDKVSIGDLAIVAAHYGMSISSPGWEDVKQLDLNNDHVIDIADLAIIAKKIFE